MPQDVSKKPGQNAASTARILPAKPDSAVQPQDPDPPRLRTDGECVATAPWRSTFNSSASPLGQHIARSRLPIRADHGHHVCSGDRRGWLGTPSCHRPARPGPFQPFLTFSACCLLISPPRPGTADRPCQGSAVLDVNPHHLLPVLVASARLPGLVIWNLWFIWETFRPLYLLLHLVHLLAAAARVAAGGSSCGSAALTGSRRGVRRCTARPWLAP